MNKKELAMYLKGNSESINNISERLRLIAYDILDYSGGLECDSTDTFARDIIGAAGLLDYMSRCMITLSKEEKKDT